MSYFDDQEEAWFASNCQGSIEDYDPHDPDSWPQERSTPLRSQKVAKSQRKITRNTRKTENAHA